MIVKSVAVKGTPQQSAAMSDDDRLQRAIDDLIAQVRADQSGAEEIRSLKLLISQLRDANQNLVLATVKAQTLKEEAETLNRRQNEFLAMLAHELRNPMAPISNAAILLEKIIAAHPLLPQIQGIISRQVGHMAHLLDDLLDASRITSGKVSLKKSTATLNEVLAHSVEVSRPFIEKRAQQLIIEPVSESILIDADVVRLSQVFSNLLINASKFTHEGGKIVLSARLHLDTVLVSVKDNGKGMEQELQPHIFDLFTQGPRSLERSEGGLGIGLSIAKGLVELHGGRITARSDGIGFGSEFSVMLPTLHNPAANQPVMPAMITSPAAQCCRVLLIEDNADSNATLQMLLEFEGHHVTAALDGLTGVSLAKANAYDIIICDIGLPGMDGYEVMSQIRRQADRPRPFAIGLSGYGQPEDRARAIEAGFDHYLIKPVKSEFLIHLLATRHASGA